MLDLLKYTLVFFLLGFLPIFFFLLKRGINIHTNIIVSIAFSPVLIAGINIINVILEIQGTLWQYLLPSVLIAFVTFFPPVWKQIYSASEFKEAANNILKGVFFGSVYWYIFFYPDYKDGSLYTDIMWNMGIVNEFKNHFPPSYPHWTSDGVFLYHYLGNIGFAGISNLSGLGIIQTVLKCGNLVNSISIFVILSLILRNNIVEKLTISLLILFVSLVPGWALYNNLWSHITGYAASSFFWSLPVLFASVHVILYLDQKRIDNNDFLNTIIYLFIVVFATGFTKISNLLVLVSIEFGLFLRFVINNHIYRISSLRKLIKPILTFLIIPSFSFLLLFFFTLKGDRGLVLGIEIRDFLIFDSWNPIYPFLAIYAPILVFMLFHLRKFKEFRWEFLLCGIINLVFFFITRHAGSSDVYFGFNAIICNVLFVSFTSIKSILKTYIYSYILCGAVILISSDFGFFKGFSPFDFNLKSKRHLEYTNYNFHNSEVEELVEISKYVSKDALIAVPQQEKEYNFIYSAFLGRRIWNETSRNLSSVYSNNTLLTDFYMKQGFVPAFFSDKPRIENDDSAYYTYLKTIKTEDFINLENQDERFSIYQKYVFEERPFEECEKIVNKFKWTHIIIKESEMQKINTWLKSKGKISEKNFTIFNVSAIKEDEFSL
jgi:hypothetical protein